jgi:predicted ArsR family transcriptional regulator
MKRQYQSAEQHMLETLSAYSPMSYRDYAELTGASEDAAFERLRRLWNKKVLFIAGYQPTKGGRPLPLYAIGALPDELKPKAKTTTERTSAYEKKLLAEGGARLKKQRAKRQKRHKYRMRTDPVYAESVRKRQAAHRRKVMGYQPRMPKPAKIDPLLSILMGVKP